MRAYTRIIFGLNTLYQLAVGVLFLAAPASGVTLYGFPESDAHMASLLVALRALGAFIIVGGVISGMIAKNPDQTPVLLGIMGLLSALTLLTWGIALAGHEMTLAQASLDIAVQVLILIAVAGHYATAKRSGGGTASARM